MRISDWSSDVCSSDLEAGEAAGDGIATEQRSVTSPRFGANGGKCQPAGEASQLSRRGAFRRQVSGHLGIRQPAGAAGAASFLGVTGKAGLGQPSSGAGTRPGRKGPAFRHAGHPAPIDRKSVVEGKSGSVRVDPGGCRYIKKKKK